MKNIIDKKQYGKLPPLGQANKEIEIPSEKQKYIRMLDNFFKLMPNEKSGNPIRYSAAYTLFEYGHYTKALTRFENIVNDIPKTKQGRSAVKIILAYYSENKKWDKLIAVCRKLLRNKNIAKSNLKKRLESTLRDSLLARR